MTTAVSSIDPFRLYLDGHCGIWNQSFPSYHDRNCYSRYKRMTFTASTLYLYTNISNVNFSCGILWELSTCRSPFKIVARYRALLDHMKHSIQTNILLRQLDKLKPHIDEVVLGLCPFSVLLYKEEEDTKGRGRQKSSEDKQDRGQQNETKDKHACLTVVLKPK